MTSADPPSSWQLAAGLGILSAPTCSAGAFVPPTASSRSGKPGAWRLSSSLILGDAALA